MDIFFYEAFAEEDEALKRHLPAKIKAGYTWKTIQEHGGAEPPAPLISIRTQSRIPLAWQTKLSGILSRSTGFDHLKSYLRECGADISCGSLPPYCSRAVAEQAMLAWMALLRKMPLQIKQFAGFNRDGLTGRECAGRTLLVVGVGNIGYEVTRIGAGLGMKVLGVDIVKKHPSVEYVSMAEGMAAADIIVCAMNLTADNRAYFNYSLLKDARPGLIFVNIARGEMSPAADLRRLLAEGRLGGVALDVFNHENELAISLRRNITSADDEVQATLEMAKRPDVVLTPHNAFNTLEAVDRKSSLSARQAVHFLENGSFIWPVPEQN